MAGKFRTISTGAGVALLLLLFGVVMVSPTQAAGKEDGGLITPRVIGGSVAPNGSWPSQAALLYSSVPNPSSAQFCGGTLIDEYWVLTAAHCVTDENGVVDPTSSIQVAIGINDLTSISSSDRINLTSIEVNPGWNPTTEQWDFALLELGTRSNQPTTEMIAPSEASSTSGGQPAEVAGWGCTSQSGGNCNPGGYPNDLMEADVTFISDALCSSGPSYGASFYATSMICAGNFSTGTPDTCYGDSGGPLIAFVSGGGRRLAGLTSWGNECALPNFPGVYSRVLSARDWVLATLGANLRLEVTKSGSGSGAVTSNPSGISCGSTCSADFTGGTTVTLTAKPDSGSGFKGWSGPCSGTATCQVTLTEANQVGAAFAKGPTASLKAKPSSKTDSRKATFKFKSSQSGSSFKCQLDGKSWGKCSSPKTYKKLKRGRNHTFRVKAIKDGVTGSIKKYGWYVKN
ncbi:MAG: trypsin-like serine protease [Solirubrobacterales bacterium]